MSIITTTEVRDVCGAPADLISDAQIQGYIETVEYEMARWLNTQFVPKETIEIVDGNGTSRMFTKQNPVLSIRGLTVNNNETITPKDVDWSRESGKIWMKNSSKTITFLEGQHNTFIKYVYGFVTETNTSTLTIADITPGTNVVIEVDSITGLAKDDWVEIYGMDGNKEACKIIDDPAGLTIQVDKVVKDHEAGSKVVKIEVPDYIRKYMIIEAGICAGINAMGATYVFNAGYSLGDLNVTKGVPYTHWKASVDYLLKEREMRKERIKPRFKIM